MSSGKIIYLLRWVLIWIFSDKAKQCMCEILYAFPNQIFIHVLGTAHEHNPSHTLVSESAFVQTTASSWVGATYWRICASCYCSHEHAYLVKQDASICRIPSNQLIGKEVIWNGARVSTLSLNDAEDNIKFYRYLILLYFKYFK